MNQAKLIQVAKEKTSSTDAGLARTLGVERQRIHKWKKGIEGIPDHHAVALAAMAQTPADICLTAIHAERADNRTKAIWEEIAQKVERAAALLIALAILASPGDQHTKRGEEILNANDSQNHNTFYSLCEIATGLLDSLHKLDQALRQEIPTCSDRRLTIPVQTRTT